MMIFQLNTKEIWKLDYENDTLWITLRQMTGCCISKLGWRPPTLWGNMRTGVPRMDDWSLDFDKIQILLSVVVSCTVCNWRQLADVS